MLRYTTAFIWTAYKYCTNSMNSTIGLGGHWAYTLITIIKLKVEALGYSAQ